MHASELIPQLQQDPVVAPLLPALACTRQDGHWLTCAALLQRETLATVLDEFAVQEGHPGGDMRAIASLWSRWHFWALLAPLVAAQLLHRQTPSLQAIALSPQQRTCGLQWQPCLQAFSPQTAPQACESVVHQTRPLIQILATFSGAAPKVFWNNLGNLLEYLVSQLRQHPGVCAQTLQAFDALLEQADLSDGSPNPLQRPVRYVPDKAAGENTAAAGLRIRKLCCLYYLLPGTELCSNCPRPKPKPCHVPT